MDRSLALNRGPWPWGAIGALILIVIIEGRIAATRKFWGEKPASWRYAAESARGPARSAEVIVLGDSMAKFGVLPAVIGARAGLSAFNLALFDGPPLASLALLEARLDQGAPPRAIVINLMPHQLARPLLDPKHGGMWRHVAGLVQSCRFGARFNAVGLPLDVVWSTALPSLAARDGLRAAIEAAIAGRGRASESVVRVYARNWHANRGAHVLEERAGRGDFAPDNHELFPSDWRPDPANLAVARDILALAARHGVRVHWLISPLHPDAAALLETRGVMPRYVEVVHRLAREFPELSVLDARGLDLRDTDFIDAVHLDRGGAIALSESIARALVAAPPARGWVQLDRIVDPPPAPFVEDVGQSRLAERADRAARR
jgi:hypothetical protein